ncbi:MAG: MASE3 domain-containing protein [Promethearchaeota archaeon]
MTKLFIFKKAFLEGGLFSLILIVIIITRLYSYLLFHSIAEFYSIVISSVIFVIVWTMRKEIDNSFFLVLGISSLFIAMIDFIHTLAYPGMGIIHGGDTNLASQLWIVARFMEAFSILFGIWMINKKVKPSILMFIYSIITCIFIIIIFIGLFPDTFIEGSGLTPFKIISEYIIILIFIVSIILIYRSRAGFRRSIYYLIIAFLVSLIISEFCFTLYLSAYELPSLIGHVFKIIGTYFLYKAMIQIGLKNPVDLLFRKLNISKNKFEEAYNQADFLKDLIAHDINNILQVILLGISKCQKLIKSPEKHEDLKKQLQLIESQVMDGAKLVSDVITFSKLEDMEKIFKPIEINSILQETVNHVKNAFQERDMTIQIETVDKNSYVHANELIGGVFENILINAVKHNEKIPLEILVKISREHLKNKSYLKMEFMDNGKGIDDNKKKGLFQKDIRFDRSLLGMGIGLSLVKKIIDLFDGKIWIEDRIKGDYSKGCNFIILVPEAMKPIS